MKIERFTGFNKKYSYDTHRVVGRTNMQKQQKGSNGCVWSQTGKKYERVTMVKGVDGTWTIPGGAAEHGETSYETALREFEEETGKKLRQFLKNGQHNYNGHTDIFYGKTNERFLPFIPTSEILERRFVKIKKLIEFSKDGFKIVSDSPEFILRPVFRRSLIDMIATNVHFREFITPHVSKK